MCILRHWCILRYVRTSYFKLRQLKHSFSPAKVPCFITVVYWQDDCPHLSDSWRICGMPMYFWKCSSTLTTPWRRLATSPYCLFRVIALQTRQEFSAQHLLTKLLNLHYWIWGINLIYTYSRESTPPASMCRWFRVVIDVVRWRLAWSNCLMSRVISFTWRRARFYVFTYFQQIQNKDKASLLFPVSRCEPIPALPLTCAALFSQMARALPRAQRVLWTKPQDVSFFCLSYPAC